MEKNHNLWITKIRWKTENQQLKSINELKLDCFVYSFYGGLKFEQQQLLVDFMCDSDNLNSLTPVDFCNFFLRHNIEFKLSFKYSKKRTLRYNYNGYRIIKCINKQINELN